MKQIATLGDLAKAVENKRSVIVPKSHPWSKPRPASVLIHQQGISLLRLFRMGMFLYTPTKKKKEDKHYERRPNI